ncbi:unnamed protein product [Ceutorhynchus assimilis]|uniref:Mediator of RNA polymerase II transcription subunit 31 n=1 Tax=Ceutorhynchus assimilis TaxID=467358 RepID=A0A9N9QPA2_9CUCU|nr:unnamed protein product [Ceutorhynchus assimilis]
MKTYIETLSEENKVLATEVEDLKLATSTSKLRQSLDGSNVPKKDAATSTEEQLEEKEDILRMLSYGQTSSKEERTTDEREKPFYARLQKGSKCFEDMALDQERQFEVKLEYQLKIISSLNVEIKTLKQDNQVKQDQIEEHLQLTEQTKKQLLIVEELHRKVKLWANTLEAECQAMGKELRAERIEGQNLKMTLQEQKSIIEELENKQRQLILAQRGYFKDSNFINYLKYLLYWKEPDYAKYLKYPMCLYFLDLLQYEHFRRELVNGQCTKFIDDQQILLWQHYTRRRSRLMTTAAANGANTEQNAIMQQNNAQQNGHLSINAKMT